MIKILNLFFVLCFISIQIKLNSAAAPYSKCLLKQTPVKINNIEIEGCTSKKRCTIKQGTKAKITIKFTPDKDYKNIERVIFGIMNNGTDNAPDAVEVPFNKKKEGCGLITGNFAGGDCKKNGLQKGEEYTFVDVMEILPEYPKLSLTARYILREENARGSTTPLDRKQKSNWKFHPGQTLFCLRIPLAIK